MIPTAVLGPREILYAQVMRVLDSRANGHGAVEAMSGLQTIIDPLKDRTYYEELRYLANSNDSDRLLWQTLECVIRLLYRRGLWPASHPIVPGEEFLSGVGSPCLNTFLP